MYGKALIKNGIVENLIVADDSYIPQDGYVVVSIEGLSVSVGDSWDGVDFATIQPSLNDSQQSKIAKVTAGYQAELNSTFVSSATGTALVYDFSPNSQSLWKELMDAVNAGYVPDTMFPMGITLDNGTVIPHEKTQLQQIFGEITARKLQLYGKLQSMVTVGGTILSATTIDAVDTITW